MDTYFLWTFFDSQKIVITRGRTQEEAFKHASRSWERGQTITLSDSNPIQGANLYSLNHSPGWLYRPPMWLQKNHHDIR
jgi:hypothetical protein